jgi:hypothetical protein
MNWKITENHINSFFFLNKKNKKLIINNLIIKFQLLYTTCLKNWEFDKKASQNSDLERATIVRAQGASEDENFEKKPTQSKTNFSDTLCIRDRPQTIPKQPEESGIWQEGSSKFTCRASDHCARTRRERAGKF